MKELLLLKRIDFDSMENQYSDAIRRKTIGVFPSSKEVAKWLEPVQKEVKTYQGWDGITYPFFELEVIQVMSEIPSPITEERFVQILEETKQFPLSRAFAHIQCELIKLGLIVK